LKYHSNRISKNILIAIAVGMFCYSCKNKKEDINELYTLDGGPIEVSENVEMTFSDSGTIQMKMIAPILEKYDKEEGVELVWPSGVEIIFYDSINVVKSKMKANKAFLFEGEKYMLVQNNVNFSNIENEKLETEELKIFFEKDSLYSDKFVKITTKDGVITGQKLISNLAFTKYRILNIRDSYYNVEVED